MRRPLQRRRIRTIALTGALLLNGCGDVAEPAAGRRAPVELISGFRSYQSVAEVQAQLGPLHRWSVREDSRAPARGICPRFDAFKVSVASWTHLDESGELWLDFVNGSLASVAFFPDSPDRYIERLRSTDTEIDEGPAGSRSIGAVLSSLVSPITSRLGTRARVWRATAYTGRDYVGWEDPQIEEEIGAWISSCT
jgi:hypothetical protein